MWKNVEGSNSEGPLFDTFIFRAEDIFKPKTARRFNHRSFKTKYYYIFIDEYTELLLLLLLLLLLIIIIIIIIIQIIIANKRRCSVMGL